MFLHTKDVIMKLFLGIFILVLFISGCSSGGGDGGGSQTPTTPANNTPTVEQMPLVVIQIEFNDFQIQSDNLTWALKIFNNHEGDLNHYFATVSKESFTFIPAMESYLTGNDGIITVALNKNHPGDSNAPFTYNLVDAITLADAYINFSDYDSNENNILESDELQIMFLVAGGETAYGDPAGSSIWAHKWCLHSSITAPPPVLDGITLMECGSGNYSRFGERHGGHDATIGIIAHELGHSVFELPDLYDIDGSSEGIGSFGLMGSGSWGYKAGEFQGTTPVHMSAWSKLKSHFTSASFITSNVNNLALDNSESANYQPLRINTQNSSEYFLLENRSASGYDTGLFMLDSTPFLGGLAIWHIDETQPNNNDETHKLVDLVEADGFHLDTAGNYGEQTNLFYTGNLAGTYTGELTPTSTPSTSATYTGDDTNISITNISIPGETMYLDLSF